MSRSLVAASSQYLTIDEAAVTAAPCTLCFWFNTASTAASSRSVVAVGSIATAAHYFRGNLFDAAVYANARDGGTEASANASSYSASTWTFGAARFSSTTLRNAFMNTTKSADNTTSRTPAGLDRTRVGRRADGTGTDYFDGLIAEVSIFDYAVSDSDLSSLAGGTSPMALTTPPVRYYRFKVDGDLSDETGAGADLTNSSTTFDASNPTVDDPPVGGSDAPETLRVMSSPLRW